MRRKNIAWWTEIHLLAVCMIFKMIMMKFEWIHHYPLKIKSQYNPNRILFIQGCFWLYNMRVFISKSFGDRKIFWEFYSTSFYLLLSLKDNDCFDMSVKKRVWCTSSLKFGHLHWIRKTIVICPTGILCCVLFASWTLIILVIFL